MIHQPKQGLLPLLVVYIPKTRSSEALSSGDRQRFLAEAVGFRCAFPENEEELIALAPTASAYIGATSSEFAARAKRLEWMQQISTGTDWLSRCPEVASADFILTNISDNHHRALAEHVMAWILSFARQLPRAYRFQHDATWDHDIERNPSLFELREKTLLLLGYGAIGSDIAQLASAFGTKILAMRRTPSQAAPPVSEFVDRTNWHATLARADLVVNTLPLTPETEDFLDATAFAHFKKGAYFFNIGRGATVDERALIDALKSGHLAGAGIDVFRKEPLPPQSPFWKMPNVLVTSHGAGASPGSHARRLEVALDNLRRYRSGQPLRNVVDKQAGY